MARRVSPQRARADSPQACLVADAVCGMSVDPAAGGPRVESEGVTFYFCSEECAERFRADPEAFAGHDHGGDGRGRAAAANTSPSTCGSRSVEAARGGFGLLSGNLAKR